MTNRPIIYSGRKKLLQLLQPLLPADPCIVEAGAFDGKDSCLFAQTWPAGKVHTFEPVPEIFNELHKNTQPYPNIACYQHALSDKEGYTTFYMAHHPKKADKLCQAGSLMQPEQRLAWSPIQYDQTMQVPTIRLSTWMQQHALDTIDLLWLDVQGHAYNILHASQEILQKIRVLHVEVEFISAYKNQKCYQDIIDFLISHGFCYYAQDFVDQKKWFYGNIIFINNNFYKK